MPGVPVVPGADATRSATATCAIHRGARASDVMRRVSPPTTTPWQRAVAIAAAFAVVAAWLVWSAGRHAPVGAALGGKPSKVVVFGMPHLGLDDLGSGETPNLDRLVGEGAVAAMSIRTLSARPNTTEGYAALNAGAKVRASSSASVAFAADAKVENSRAEDVMTRRAGRRPSGKVVVLGYPQAVRAVAGKHVSSEPGALGDALHAAGLRTAVVGNADTPESTDPRVDEISRPVAMALVDRSGGVDEGRVDGGLLRLDASAPYGVSSDTARVVAETAKALRAADVVAVDAGDLDRAFGYRNLVLDRAAEANRRYALRRTDSLLGRIRSALPRDTMLLVVSVSPPIGGQHHAPRRRRDGSAARQDVLAVGQARRRCNSHRHGTDDLVGVARADSSRDDRPRASLRAWRRRHRPVATFGT